MAIKFKGSEVPGAVPTGLGERELAFNLADKKIFSADSQGNLIDFTSNISGTDELVKISVNDTTPDYLDPKIAVGKGLSKTINSTGGYEKLNFEAETWVDILDGELIPTFWDYNRSKHLSIETQNILWSENRLSSTEWIGLSRAVDKLSGWIAPFNCTIVGYMGQTSLAGTTPKPIDLWIDGTNWGTLFSFAGSGTEDYQINNSINIDVLAGQKIRLKCGGGPTIEDTVIELRIRWKIRNAI